MAATITTTATQAHCLRCGRVLTSTASIARGYGRGCAARIATAAKASTDKATQVEKALTLITDGGVVRIHRGRAIKAVSTKGDTTYLAAPTACTCPAGRVGRRCYHSLAASLLAA